MNPEDNNKQTAPTTVGGVTFGGGSSAPVAPAPAAPVAQTSTTAPVQAAPQANASVDPIVTSTGEEFDAVMNGISMAPVQDFNQAPVPSNLNTQVASPTHFDNQNTVKPIVVDPGNPNANNPNAQKQAKTPKTPEELGKQVKKLSTMSVIFGILTGVFTVFAIVGLVLYINEKVTTEKLTEDFANAQKIVEAVEETTGVKITKPEEVPVYKATTGYIYLSSWNIKIKIPDNLEKISYILNENYRESICFNAVGKGVQYFPDFANIALNPGRMGCLTRIKTQEGEFDTATGISFGTKVFTYKDYSYFYTGSTDYSKDAANLGLEHTAVQLIKNMLTDNIEQYE